ncbi:hypothetical protein [Silvanigrella sp.]|jgi:hypothetical protein|uniref:hypothetical protein n=1 Tax=Silvanigrella sp. TaxID=2024976 RepID=UPI0037C77B23
MNFLSFIKPKPHVYLDIHSANPNSTGYTLNIEILKAGKIILETGINNFKIEEGISKFFNMTFSLTLAQNEFTSLCFDMLKKGNIFNLETISPFFYFKNVHAYLRDAKRNMVREFNAYIANVDVSSFSNGEEDFVNITFMAYPLPWFMQETNNYLVYVNKTIQDIIKDVFTDFCKNSFITEPYSPVFVVKPKKNNFKDKLCTKWRI